MNLDKKLKLGMLYFKQILSIDNKCAGNREISLDINITKSSGKENFFE